MDDDPGDGRNTWPAGRRPRAVALDDAAENHAAAPRAAADARAAEQDAADTRSAVHRAAGTANAAAGRRTAQPAADDESDYRGTHSLHGHSDISLDPV
jgi:hypothetical protein